VSVQLELLKVPVPVCVKPTVPVGVLCVPASVSLTVAVQVVETPTGTSGGEQATLVLVARLFTFRSNASLLALCVSSAP